MDIKKMTEEEIKTIMHECAVELNERNEKRERKLTDKVYNAIQDILDEGYEISLFANSEEVIILDDTVIRIELY